ncbi:MAG: LCP family protein [Actinobacteria bacterium]|nr:LCP family protein [Actinomycetota bacterium]
MRFAALGLTAALLLALASTLALWRYADSRLEREEIPAIEANRDVEAAPAATGEGEPAAPLPETLNVLVVGTDSREGLTDQQLLELGTEDVGTALTDTIMLVQLSPLREEAAIVSFPRDLRVDVPGEGVLKINAVHPRGGADLLVRTVQDLTDITVDHYVEVNIAGFLEVTDAVGGVEVCLDEPMVDRYAGVDLPAGCQTLDGRKAAGFVRSRRVRDQFGADDDFGRIARQQYFIRQAMERITSANTLANPVRVKRLIDAVAGAVTTDTDLGATQMLRLADSLADISPETVSTRAVPGYYSNETGFVHPYEDQAEALFSALREGTRLPDVGLTAPAELVAGDVTVVVLNGEGTGGLATEVQAFLEARGFEVVATGNAGTDEAPDFSYATTEVAYVPDDEAKARLVADFLPGARLVELDEPAVGDVVVTVGADWSER